MMRWVRKGNIVAGLAAAVLLCAFLGIFKDPLLKWGFKKALRAAAGAKVDIGSVGTSLWRGRLVLSRVAVADKNEPMKNLFSFETAAFQFSPRAALRVRSFFRRPRSPDCGSARRAKRAGRFRAGRLCSRRSSARSPRSWSRTIFLRWTTPA